MHQPYLHGEPFQTNNIYYSRPVHSEGPECGSIDYPYARELCDICPIVDGRAYCRTHNRVIENYYESFYLQKPNETNQTPVNDAGTLTVMHEELTAWK